jgi:HK97 family phage prohead protease
MNEMERRSFEGPIEIEERADGRPRFRGMAAVFNTPSRDLGGFREIIAPGAFDAVLTRSKGTPGRPSIAERRLSDVIAVWNHDPGQLLGRLSSGTLTLAADETGLRYEIDPPDTQLARDLGSLLRRGDVFGSSFAFTVDDSGQEWQTDETGGSIRMIRAVSGLYDVSLVTNPATLAATVSLRSFEQWRESRAAPAAVPAANPESVAAYESQVAAAREAAARAMRTIRRASR